MYFYANGNVYRGAWKNDKKDGRGVITTPTGYSFEGEYKGDKMD